MLMWAPRKKLDKCIKCELKRFRHKGNGLCVSCWDKKRAESPKRKEQLKKQLDRWYNKVKNSKEYQEYNRSRGIEWRKTSRAYQNFLKRQYIKWSYKRFLKTRYHNHWKDGVEIIVDGKRIQTPVKSPIKQGDKEEAEFSLRMNIFKELIGAKDKPERELSEISNWN